MKKGSFRLIIKMLLSKKLLHLVNFLKKQKVLKTFFLYSICYNLKKKMTFFIVYLSVFKYFLKEKQLPSFLITFNLNVVNNFFFNNVLLKVFNVIKGVNIDTSLIFSSVKTKKKKYTVLRSPFVHKKSKEQFSFETFMGFFTVNLKQKSIFILDYLEFA
jgi:ribosomal protein S10